MALAIAFIALALYYSPRFHDFKSKDARSIDLSPFKKGLIVYAHTDDELIPSAMIHYLASQGIHLTILIWTDGKANPKTDLSSCAIKDAFACRTAELFKAAEILGINAIWTPGYPDSKLNQHIDRGIDDLASRLRENSFDFILTTEPSGFNYLTDHTACFSIVAGALKKLQKDQIPVPSLFLSTPPYPYGLKFPTDMPKDRPWPQYYFALTEADILRKIEHQNAYQSQMATIQGIMMGIEQKKFWTWMDRELYWFLTGKDLVDFLKKY